MGCSLEVSSGAAGDSGSTTLECRKPLSPLSWDDAQINRGQVVFSRIPKLGQISRGSHGILVRIWRVCPEQQASEVTSRVLSRQHKFHIVTYSHEDLLRLHWDLRVKGSIRALYPTGKVRWYGIAHEKHSRHCLIRPRFSGASNPPFLAGSSFDRQVRVMSGESPESLRDIPPPWGQRRLFPACQVPSPPAWPHRQAFP
jgi:hypothetical protein